MGLGYAGAAADLSVVGLAALTLLADAATEQPVMWVVDDARWLEQASSKGLGLIPRRLFADRVGMLLAVREPICNGPAIKLEVRQSPTGSWTRTVVPAPVGL